MGLPSPRVPHNSVILDTARVEVGGGRDLGSPVSFVLHIVAGRDKVAVQPAASTSHGEVSQLSVKPGLYYVVHRL